MKYKKTLYFITSNKSKLEEARELLSDVVQLEQLDIDLPEIQEIDAHKVVRAKLKEATAHHPGPFIVDDVSVHFPAMGGLPGPLIKWFLVSMEREQIHEMLKKLGDTRAQVKLTVGYARNHDDIHFFDGAVEGIIVAPRGSRFGWDPIFQPDGHQKTYAEMTPEEKNKISHRAIALKKLKKFLQN